MKKTEEQISLTGLESVLENYRGYVIRPPKDEEVVFIASGGLDSSCGMAMVIEEYNCKVFPLFVRRHSKAMQFEEESFDKICEYLADRYPDNFMAPEKIEVGVPPRRFKEGITMHRKATTGHALRNSSLQNLGVQYAVHLNDAKQHNIKVVFTGSVADDTFPHNSLVYFRIQTLLTCCDLADSDWQIISPFIDPHLPEVPAYKKEMIKWAFNNGFPLELTRTCTRGGAISCGECGECLPRLAAFETAGYNDPIEYLINIREPKQ